MGPPLPLAAPGVHLLDEFSPPPAHTPHLYTHTCTHSHLYTHLYTPTPVHTHTLPLSLRLSTSMSMKPKGNLADFKGFLYLKKLLNQDKTQMKESQEVCGHETRRQVFISKHPRSLVGSRKGFLLIMAI